MQPVSNVGLPHGLELIDKKLNKGTPASTRGMHARRNYPPCIPRCNKECLLSEIPKWVLESLFLPTYGISRSALKGLPSIDKMAKRLHKATWDEEKKKKKKPTKPNHKFSH